MVLLSSPSGSSTGLQIFGLDAGLLSLSLQANLALRTSTSSVEARIYEQFRGLEPAVVAPWEIPSEPQTLARRIREVMNLDTFVDLRSDIVTRAGNDVDSRSLFALYGALTALQTLAQYGAEENTPAASLARLDVKFQQGFGELQDFLSTAEFNRITMLLGEKNDDVRSSVGLGRDRATVAGDIIQTGNRGDALAGIAGTEVFTVRIEKSGVADDITVDLSQIAGTITIDAVVDLINQQIEALTVVDGQGNTVAKHQTRFSVQRNADTDYFIQVDGTATETVTLIPQSAEPVLFVSGARTPVTGDGDAAAILTTISNIGSATPLHNLGQDISGTDIQATAIQEEAALLAGEADAPPPATAASTAGGVAVDSLGNLYVVGTSQGSFDDQINTASSGDVFLTKFDSRGNVIYSRLLGASDSAEAFAIAVDADDNIVVAGRTDSDLSGSDVVSGSDAFVTKFNSRGDEIFTAQLDTVSDTAALALAVDAVGDVYVAGYSDGAISASSGFGGGRDGLIMKLSGSDGSVQASTLIGGSGNEEVSAIAIAADGGILIASEEDGTAYLRKLDAATLAETYSLVLGALSGGAIGGIAVDGSAVYVAGSTGDAAFDGGGGTATNAHSGSIDGFVARIDDAGASASANFTTFVGGAGSDSIADVTISGGSVYVAGRTTASIAGETELGSSDGFAAKLDGASGAIAFVDQFGAAFTDSQVSDIAFVASGRSVLDALGLRTGIVQQAETRDIVTQSSVNDGDFFYISVNGGAKRRITIYAGDTFETLASRIQLLSLRALEAEAAPGADGDLLSVKAINGNEIEFFNGDTGRDALAKLGIEPGRRLAGDLIFETDFGAAGFDPADLGGIFGLDLSAGFHIRDKTTARFVLSRLDGAISTVQRAFRSLFFDPVKASLLEQERLSGTVPPYLLKQIANFEDALLRLQSASLAGPTSFFV